MSDDEKCMVKGIERNGTNIKDLCAHNRDNNDYTGHETSVSSTALMTGGDLSSGLDNFQ